MKEDKLNGYGFPRPLIDYGHGDGCNRKVKLKPTKRVERPPVRKLTDVRDDYNFDGKDVIIMLLGVIILLLLGFIGINGI